MAQHRFENDQSKEPREEPWDKPWEVPRQYPRESPQLNDETYDCNTKDKEWPGMVILANKFIYSEKLKRSLWDLSREKQMPILQLNGQRTFGPSINHVGLMPPRGTEVFFGKLPRDAFEAELVPIFLRAGPIYEMRLMMNFSGTNRGYCFVKYCNCLDASRAVCNLNGYEIRQGEFIGSALAIDHRQLSVKGFSRELTAQDVCLELEKIYKGIVCVKIRTRNNCPQRAIVEYKDHRTAIMARSKMLQIDFQIRGQKCTADWAGPKFANRRYNQ